MIKINTQILMWKEKNDEQGHTKLANLFITTTRRPIAAVDCCWRRRRRPAGQQVQCSLRRHETCID